MPSTLIRSSTDEVAIRLTAAFFGVAPSNATLNSYKAEVARVGESAFARNLASAFDNLTNAQLTTTVLNNLGVSAATIGAAGFAALEPALTTLFGAFAKSDRGQIVMNITRLLAGLEGDVTYGAAAAAWNSATDSAFAYSSGLTATTSTPIAILGVRLTASPDDIKGVNFFSLPVFTPGGNTLINSLQDEDILTGTGAANSLTVTLGTVNDNQEGYIEPKLNKIQTVNVEVTGGGSAGGIGFRDGSDLTNLNVTRITSNNANVKFGDLPAGATNLSVSSATTGGNLNFEYREDVLTKNGTGGFIDALIVTLNAVRAAQLNIVEGTDGGADSGYFFEKITASTNGATDIDLLSIQQNGKEDVDIKATKTDTTKQEMSITAGGTSLEINTLRATGLDTLSIVANATVDIARDISAALTSGTAESKSTVVNATVGTTVSQVGGAVTTTVVSAANGADNVTTTVDSGLVTTDLEVLNISGGANVRIDGVRGDAATGLKVNADTMTGNLRAGVQGGTSSKAEFALKSGSGNDEIRTFGALGGPVATNAGTDSVTIGGAISATGSVNTGPGNDTVLVGTAAAPANLEAKGDTSGVRNDNATDSAASIDTGDGNDTVTVAQLGSAVSWTDGKADDGNADDFFVRIGASVKTGAGDDSVVAGSLLESALIDTGAGNDSIRIEQTGTTVLAADTAANVTTLTFGVPGSASTVTALANREVSATDATKMDALGAIIDLGEGDDAIDLNDTLSFSDADDMTVAGTSATLIVDTDAEVRGGAGNDVINVTALDSTTVTTDTTFTVGGTTNDVNANVIGVETANFTIANQITNANDALNNAGTAADRNLNSKNTRNDSYAGNLVINDNSVLDGSITADMLRFDSALKTVNLVSEEDSLLLANAQEIYEAGSATTFTLKNLGTGVQVTLKAQEANGIVDATGAAATTGTRSNNTTTDVTLNVNAAEARGTADELKFAFVAGSGAFDIALNLGTTTTDQVAATASATDDENKLYEKVTISLASDDKGHAIALGGSAGGTFGDAAYTLRTATNGFIHTANQGTFNQFRNTAGKQDASLAEYNALSVADKAAFGQGNSATTEFTLGDSTNGTVAGTTTVVTGISADKITLNGAGTVGLTVSHANNYTVVSGTGADTLNMTADTVDDEDAIDGGTGGRNTLVINGANSIGFRTDSQPENDDAWANKKNLQILEIRPGSANGTNTVVLDEQTFATGIDTIRLTNATAGTINQTTNVVFGDDFRRDTAIATTNNLGSTQINVTNRVSAADTTQTVTLFADGGAGYTVNDLYGRSKANVTVTLNRIVAGTDAAGTTTISSAANGATDGDVAIVSNKSKDGALGTISSITLVDNNRAPTGLAAGASFDTGAVSVTVDDSWSRGTFTLDASGITNSTVSNDGTLTTTAFNNKVAENLADGGLVFTGANETDAALTVIGTGNSDNITGGAAADSLTGGDGNDTINGGVGADTISGGANNDALTGGDGADVIDGGVGADTIIGGNGADVLTGGDGNDVFNYSAVIESSGAAADTLVNFVTKEDKISITGETGRDVVNLGRFSTTAGNSSLEQKPFDAYFFGGQLAVDFDADGQINENLDLIINSEKAIAAGDINYTLTLTGNSAKTVRLGQGVDSITTNAGAFNDTFVVVGTITAAQAQAYAAGGAAKIPAAAAGVVSLAEISAQRDVSEVNVGDSINGGLGTDELITFGTVNFSGVTLSANITKTTVNSTVVFTPAQLAQLTSITINGDQAHTIRVIQPAVGSNPATELTAAQVKSLLNGGSVTVNGVTSGGSGVAKSVALTNAGVNTTVTFGNAADSASGASAQTVTQFRASSGLNSTAIAGDTFDVSKTTERIVLATDTVTGLTGTVSSGSTYNTSTLDKIVGFGSGDTLQLPFAPTSVVTDNANFSQITGTTIGRIAGTYDATNNVFTPGSGSDTMIVYDNNGAAAGGQTEAVILVGFGATATGVTGGTGSTGTFGG